MLAREIGTAPCNTRVHQLKFKVCCSPGTSRFEIIVSESPLVIQCHSDAVPGKEHTRRNTSEWCGSACGFVLWGQVSGGSGTNMTLERF